MMEPWRMPSTLAPCIHRYRFVSLPFARVTVWMCHRCGDQRSRERMPDDHEAYGPERQPPRPPWDGEDPVPTSEGNPR